VSAEQDVLAAAADLVSAFGSHDREGYFASFEPGATFLFHSADALLGSRAAYEGEWDGWVRAGLEVLGCVSTEQRADLLGEDVAVFTHRVRTHLRDAEGEHRLAERETIVLRRQPDGRWLGVHEHLSVDPRA
jgi:ketosteroid isomerase-like protein